MAGHWDDEQSIDSKGKKAKPRTRTIYPWELLRFATPIELFVFFVGCIGAIGTGSGLPVMSILMGTTTQAFTNLALTGDYGAFSDAVKKSCVQFSILGGGIYICAIIQCLCSVYVCDRMIDRLRRRFLSSILRQDITWFDKNHSGTLAPKLFDNLERVREGSGDKIALMIQMLSQFIGGYVVAFTHNWSLTLILLSLTPFIMICGAYVGKMRANIAIMEASMYEIAGGIAEEVLTSIRTVIAFNGQQFESERYHSALKDGRRAGIIKNIKSGVGIGLTFFFMMSSIGLAFYVGTTYVAEGKTDGGTVLTIFFSVLMGSMALGQAGPQFAVIGTAMGAAASIYEVVDRKPQIDAYSTEGVKPKNLKGKITIENVHFAYPTRSEVPILKGVSLTAEPGQTIALVGSSGSGKSTIIQLLLRYYSQLSGTIKIDDHRIEDINLEYLRNYLGVVSQEPNLFATTIEENIRYGRKDVTEKEIIEALKLANAYAFVKKFPQGIHTLVGDRGAQLSGGQKQRIAIARALVRNPKVLLLDEATSALDAQSEHVVQKALDNAAKGRTTVVIAHRLSTIRNADQIIAMKDGKVVEAGTHDSLLPRKGLYYELVNAQVFTDIDSSKSDSRRMSVMSNRSRADTEMEGRNEAAEFVDHSAIEDNAARLKREAKEENVKPANLIEIIRRSRPEWINLAIGFTSAAIQGCVFPSFALIFVQLIQTFAEPKDQMKKDGHFWALFFVLEGVIMLVTMILQCTFFGAASERVAMRLRSRVFRNVLRQDAYYFDQPKHSAGKIVTRLANDAPSLKAALDFRLGSAFSAVVGVIFGVGVAFYFGWQMACLTVIVFPLVSVGQAIQQFLLLGDSTGSANELANSGKTAMEAIENIRTVQALTMQQTIYDQFCKYIRKPVRHTLRSAIIQGLVYGFATSITFFIFAACFRFGLWLIVNNTLEPYNVLKVLFATQFCAQSLGMFSGYFPEYSRATFAAGLIFSMLDKKPKIDGMSESGKKPNLAGNIAVKDVYFRYPQRPDIPILRGLNVSVNTGKTLALVGPSGCGKSTIIGLLERLYDVLDGQLEVDGHDVRSLNPKHLRSQISLVSQEPVLFDRSIRENIIYGLTETVTQEQIEEACKKSNIHEFILKQPDGYNTRVGERGGQLSGGQKQRIAIARALVRDPRILLLDEATSALDTESEKVVQEALNKASVGRTCIVIAHRLSTIVDANCIAVVDKGKIIEQGTHAELIQKRGVYFDLASKQAGSKQ